MDISDKIKQLISESKTQEALDTFQQYLKDKDQNLLNQTYLLESQFKDVQKKIGLGMSDAISEINRINFTLLSLCDDVRKLPNEREAEILAAEPSGLLANPLVIFAVIAIVAIGIVISLVYFLRQ